jgi:hypothetical protein
MPVKIVPKRRGFEPEPGCVTHYEGTRSEELDKISISLARYVGPHAALSGGEVGYALWWRFMKCQSESAVSQPREAAP